MRRNAVVWMWWIGKVGAMWMPESGRVGGGTMDVDKLDLQLEYWTGRSELPVSRPLLAIEVINN